MQMPINARHDAGGMPARITREESEAATLPAELRFLQLFSSADFVAAQENQFEQRQVPPLAIYDPNPRLNEWMRVRARVAARHGTPIAVEQRLYAAVMYSDDPLIAVVGVQRAVRALRVSGSGVTSPSAPASSCPYQKNACWAYGLSG